MEEEPWRRDILTQLARNNGDDDRWKDYETAIESTSWVKTALVKVNPGGSKNRFDILPERLLIINLKFDFLGGSLVYWN